MLRVTRSQPEVDPSKPQPLYLVRYHDQWLTVVDHPKDAPEHLLHVVLKEGGPVFYIDLNMKRMLRNVLFGIASRKNWETLQDCKGLHLRLNLLPRPNWDYELPF